MIFDLHNDLPTEKLSNENKRLLELSVTDSVIYAYWTTELNDPMRFIAEGVNSRNRSYMFAVEDMGFASMSDIETLVSLNPMYCSLTHNRANALAGGAIEGGKLTNFGKEAIALLGIYDIAVDTAHLSRESFFDVADCAARIIDTHTAVDSLHPHPRNLTNEQIRIILSRGGIIGLTAVRDFIGGDSVTDYIRLIDGFVQKFGVDGAAIGTDFHGTEPLKNLNGYDDFQYIEYELENLGYTQCDIRKIFYENANNYFMYRRKSTNETRNL